jgi:non-ribosomal peptide synthetase component F
VNGDSLQIEEVGSGVINTTEMKLDESVSEGLRQLARRASVPLKSVLLAAHLRVLSLISGERDVVTGVVFNGRPETTDGERVIGMFLNTLPVRLALDGGTWEDLATATFRVERELLPYRRYPLSQIQRENGGRALFETAFNYVHFHVLEGVARLSDVEVLSTGGAADTNFTLMVDYNLRSTSISLLSVDRRLKSTMSVKFVSAAPPVLSTSTSLRRATPSSTWK